MSCSLHRITKSPEETQGVGQAVGEVAQPGDVVLLSGGLGVGKTCLTQGIAWGLGVQEHARSPTFVLVTQYQGRLPLYHIDLYRLDDVREVLDLGLDEYLFGPGVCVVEWADKAPEAFPVDHLAIHMEEVSETQRALSFTAQGARACETLQRIKGSIA